MNEYAWHLDVYSDNWYLAYNESINSSVWNNRIGAEEYLRTYWLPLHEYENKWLPIQKSIFTDSEGLPELMFKESYQLLFSEGGVLFTQKEFEAFQKTILAIGEKYFIVIQNDFKGQLKEPPFRMKYPSTITWKELKKGNFIFTAIFEIYHNEFYIFGENDYWGRYSASAEEYPLQIVGVKPEYSSVFRKNLMIFEKKWKKIKSWIPPLYKTKILQ